MGYVTPLSKTIERISERKWSLGMLCIDYAYDRGKHYSLLNDRQRKNIRVAVRAILYKHREHITQETINGTIYYSYSKP